MKVSELKLAQEKIFWDFIIQKLSEKRNKNIIDLNKNEITKLGNDMTKFLINLQKTKKLDDDVFKLKDGAQFNSTFNDIFIYNRNKKIRSDFVKNRYTYYLEGKPFQKYIDDHNLNIETRNKELIDEFSRNARIINEELDGIEYAEFLRRFNIRHKEHISALKFDGRGTQSVNILRSIYILMSETVIQIKSGESHSILHQMSGFRYENKFSLEKTTIIYFNQKDQLSEEFENDLMNQSISRKDAQSFYSNYFQK